MRALRTARCRWCTRPRRDSSSPRRPGSSQMLHCCNRPASPPRATGSTGSLPTFVSCSFSFFPQVVRRFSVWTGKQKAPVPQGTRAKTPAVPPSLPKNLSSDHSSRNAQAEIPFTRGPRYRWASARTNRCARRCPGVSRVHSADRSCRVPTIPDSLSFRVPEYYSPSKTLLCDCRAR